MRILIIAYFFPPLNSIASLRPYSWAKYWSRAGHDVTVLTIPKRPRPEDSPQSFDGFQVIEAPVPGMASLRNMFGRNIKSDAPAPVYSSNINGPANTSMKKLLFQMLLSVQQRYGIFMSCRMPDWLDIWGRVALKAVQNLHWDLVVSTAWPYGVHYPAYRLKKTGSAAYWITDWRDLWTDNHMFPGLPGFRIVERLLERRWSRAADAITTVSEPLADILRQKYGNKVHVVYNGFDPEDYEKLPAERIFPDDGLFRIVYTGSVYAGQRDPTPLFEAVRTIHKQGLTGPDRLKIIFCGSNSNVIDLARKQSVEAFVEYAGLLPRQQALRMQRDANILLFLEYESETVKGILTGKLFEYLFAGPPIWGLGMGEDSSAGMLLENTGRGKCFGRNVEKIAETLRMAISVNPKSTGMIRNMNDRNIWAFSREEQSKKMLSIVS